MSKNIDQVFVANPITSNASTDLMYFGQSPYGVGNDAAMTYSNFAAQFGAPYTAAALTKADDTNVTLTLGGTPATALLHAASITAGWTGTLSGTRGGTGVNNGASTITLGGSLTTSGAFASTFTMTNTTSVTFPTSGTLATTSQLPSAAALTKTDDTNVTLTLGGTPATALLQASSITAGWTGTLSVARGGTASSSVTTAPAASAWSGWDANKNLSANAFIEGYTTTVTAAGTTTLTVASTGQQYFTGSTTQTVVLPVTSTLVLGQGYYIVNNSSGIVTVQSSGGNTVKAMAASSALFVRCILTSGTTAASWDNTGYIVQSSGGGVTAADVQNQSAVYCVDSGSANTVVLTPSPAISAYADGQSFSFKPASASNGNITINVSGKGALPLLDDYQNYANRYSLIAGNPVTVQVCLGGAAFMFARQAYTPTATGLQNNFFNYSSNDQGSLNNINPLFNSQGVLHYAYTDGQTVLFQSSNTTTGACTLALDFLATKAFQTKQGNPLVGGEILANRTYQANYDGNRNAFTLQNSEFEFPSSFSLQTPSTGFSITVGNGVESLILNPAGTLATGTVTTPSDPKNGQELRITSTQLINSLTITANSGQTILNVPTAISTVGVGYAFKYISSTTTWYRLY